MFGSLNVWKFMNKLFHFANRFDSFVLLDMKRLVQSTLVQPLFSFDQDKRVDETLM